MDSFRTMFYSYSTSVDVQGVLKSKGHPRILIRPTSFDIACVDEDSSPDDVDLRFGLYERIVTLAVRELAADSVKFTPGIKGLSGILNSLASRVFNLAAAYRLTGDNRFADRLRLELLTVAKFPDWDPLHFLDCAQISFAVAIGFDWAYDTLSANERALIVDALCKNCLDFADVVYKQPFSQVKDPSRKPLTWVNWTAAESNWNQVCNAGFLAAALVVADEREGLIGVAQTVIDGVIRSAAPVLATIYGSDGVYPEGPSYWALGTSFSVFTIAMLESVFGSDCGFMETAYGPDIPSHSSGFSKTAKYRMYQHGPSGCPFSFADSFVVTDTQSYYTWLTLRYPSMESAAALVHSRAQLQAKLFPKGIKVSTKKSARVPFLDRVSGFSIENVSQKKFGERDAYLALHWLWFPTYHSAVATTASATASGTAADTVASPISVMATVTATLTAITTRPTATVSIPIPTVINGVKLLPTSSSIGTTESSSISSGKLEIPLDAKWKGTVELATFRGSWEDSNAWWVAVKAGRNGGNHSHLDLGSFVLDYGGLRWAEDFGTDSYALPQYASKVPTSARWQYLRCSSRGHNTITALVCRCHASGGLLDHATQAAIDETASVYQQLK